MIAYAEGLWEALYGRMWAASERKADSWGTGRNHRSCDFVIFVNGWMKHFI